MTDRIADRITAVLIRLTECGEISWKCSDTYTTSVKGVQVTVDQYEGQRKGMFGLESYIYSQLKIVKGPESLDFRIGDGLRHAIESMNKNPVLGLWLSEIEQQNRRETEPGPAGKQGPSAQD